MEQQYHQQPAYPQQAPQPVAGVQPAHAPARSSGFLNVVVPSPTWIIAVRGVQIVTSVVVLGLCGYLIHGAYADPQGFAIACSVLTWAALAYILLSEKLTSLRSAYNIFAVLGLDLFMTILWLAAMATNAHHRAAFTVPVEISGCSDDGSLVDSTTCWKLRKRRIFVAGPVGLAVMIVVAIGCALEFVLFAITFGKILAAYLQARKSTLPPPVPADGGEKLQPMPQIHVQQAYPTAPIQSPIQSPVQPPVQPPVQAQTTGGTYAPSPPPAPEYQQAQYTGNTGYAPSPPPQKQGPVYEAPTGQAQGGYVQELPGQYTGGVPPCGSPPQDGYGYPPR